MFSTRSRKRNYASALVCAGAATLALTSGPAAATRAREAATPPCTASQTQVWLGLGRGGGTAGTVYYPLEFSNVGHLTCALYGYPGVSAYRGALRQVGSPALRDRLSHATVTLAPGATGHALLGIRDWGAICSKPVTATGLKVYPPGQTAAKEIDFTFDACAHRGVLVVGPLRPGTGIPGYTGP
jgi:hypothetical protein